MISNLEKSRSIDPNIVDPNSADSNNADPNIEDPTVWTPTVGPELPFFVEHGDAFTHMFPVSRSLSPREEEANLNCIQSKPEPWWVGVWGGGAGPPELLVQPLWKTQPGGSQKATFRDSASPAFPLL